VRIGVSTPVQTNNENPHKKTFVMHAWKIPESAFPYEAGNA